jgi:pimeloyl-ACP methyl ester carboxylesterase
VEDEIVPKTLSEAYQRKHPATRVVTVPDAGHFALIDPRTPAFAAILAEIKRLS